MKGEIKVNRNLSILLIVFVLTSFLMACAPKEDEVEESILDINQIHSSIKKDFKEDYLPDRSLSLEELVGLIGIEEEWVDEFIGEVAKNEDIVDSFIAINAKKDTSYDVAQKLLRYKERLEEEGSKYPNSLAKIRASKVVRKRDSVFFIMVGKPNNFEDQESEEAIGFYEGEVQRVEGVIDKACG